MPSEELNKYRVVRTLQGYIDVRAASEEEALKIAEESTLSQWTIDTETKKVVNPNETDNRAS